MCNMYLFVLNIPNFSPCEMCTGTALLYKIPRVVVGENQNYRSQWAQIISAAVFLFSRPFDFTSIYDTFI